MNTKLISKLIEKIHPLNNPKNFLMVVGVLLILFSIPVTTYLVQKSREPVSRAQPPAYKVPPAPKADTKVYEMIVRYDSASNSFTVLRKGETYIYGLLAYGDPSASEQAKYEKFDFDIDEGSTLVFTAHSWIEKTRLVSGEEIRLLFPLETSKTTQPQAVKSKRVKLRNSQGDLNMKDQATKKESKEVDMK